MAAAMPNEMRRNDTSSKARRCRSWTCFEHEERRIEDGNDRSDAGYCIPKAYFERHSREVARTESNTDDPNPNRDAS
jgi:hypothetical protein